MTSIAHRYTDFGPLDAEGKLIDPVPIERVEDEKLAAFEEGYQAGWTDAEKNFSDEQKDFGEEFLVTLQEQSFTYQEAVTRLNRGLKPLFEQIMTSLLPATVNAVFSAHIVEQLVQLAQTQMDAEISLRVSESNLFTLEELLEGADFTTPVVLSSDSALNAHQLFVSLDTQERQIDLDAVCNEITKAMNAFNFHSQTESPDV
ncbi:MAG: hypothetical protein ABJJ53_10945 [Sulfitobacter sp.]